jgi:citrate lyase beta subunit
MMIRINGLDTHYMYRDVDIVEACPRLDMILIPKAGVAADVYAVDMLVTQIETAKKRDKRIGFEVLIETALGMANVEAIAQSSRRLEAMSFGVADYAASTRAHYGDWRRQRGLRRAHGQGCLRQSRLLLGRSVACGANPHDGRLPRLWLASD